MRALLDSHAAIWFVAADPRLSPQAKDVIDHPDTLVLLSAATVWEVGIKVARGKLKAPEGWVEVLQRSGAIPLVVTVEHATAAATLPLHHKDPFDRMLVAQSLAERAAIISRDARLRAYDVEVVW